MSKIRWAVVGTGSIASRMVSEIRRTRSGEVVALVSRTVDRGRSTAQSWGINSWSTDLGTLIDQYRGTSKQIDAVYIGTPHPAHVDPALIALDLGVPVLCEKPLTASGYHTRMVVEKAREKNVLLMEALWTKFQPLIRRLWDFMDHGHLGQVRSIRGELGFPAPFEPEGRLFNPKLGGGALLDLGVYPLWLPLAFWGEPRDLAVFGTRSSTGVDESSTALLAFSGGGRAAIETSIVSALEDSLTISGTKGRIRVPAPLFNPTKIEFIPHEGKVEIWTTRPRGLNFVHQIDHFHGLIHKGEQESPIHSLDDTLLLAKVMDQILGEL